MFQSKVKMMFGNPSNITQSLIRRSLWTVRKKFKKNKGLLGTANATLQIIGSGSSVDPAAVYLKADYKR